MYTGEEKNQSTSSAELETTVAELKQVCQELSSRVELLEKEKTPGQKSPPPPPPPPPSDLLAIKKLVIPHRKSLKLGSGQNQTPDGRSKGVDMGDIAKEALARRNTLRRTKNTIRPALYVKNTDKGNGLVKALSSGYEKLNQPQIASSEKPQTHSPSSAGSGTDITQLTSSSHSDSNTGPDSESAVVTKKQPPKVPAKPQKPHSSSVNSDINGTDPASEKNSALTRKQPPVVPAKPSKPQSRGTSESYAMYKAIRAKARETENDNSPALD